MHIKCKDERTFFSSGQDSLPTLWFDCCGISLSVLSTLYYVVSAIPGGYQS